MSFSDIRRQMKNLALSKIAQTKVRDATSNSVTYPSNKQLSDISCMTYSPQYARKIMKVLWKRLNDTKNWQHMLKGLILLEYLLLNGSVGVVEMCQENVYLICMLQTYQSAAESVDRGQLIRNKADTIYKLIQDPELLANLRHEAAEMRQKEERKRRASKEKRDSIDSARKAAPRGVKEQQSYEEFVKVEPEDARRPFVASTSLDSAMIHDRTSLENANFNQPMSVDQNLAPVDDVGPSS